ncbi:MAG TPA: Gfo/Idh/MocA family oxidoreductase [Actinomycetota bacterium]|nr:Gfo/Idh/MocA family oxidoreductase [Actinomycetota bacterium]
MGAKTIGIGLIGVGWMGEVHSRAYVRCRQHFPDCAGVARLVVAADESADRARRAADVLGYESSTTDWRDVLADPSVEAVSITSPNFLHREMALAATLAGKAIWVEKPVGVSPAETAEVAAAAARAGVISTVGLNYRQVPAVRHARDLIAGGALGEVNHFRFQFLASYASNPNGALSWRFSRDQAGAGIIADLGSHAFDMVQMLLGPIARVWATSAILIPRRPVVAAGTGTHFTVVEQPSELGDVENEDWCAATVELASGLRGTVELSRVMVGAYARYAFEVNGTAGAVQWNFERMNELQRFMKDAAGDDGLARVSSGPQHPGFAEFQPGQGLPMGYDDLKVMEANTFLQSVAEGVQRAPGLHDMLATAEVLDAVARSAKSGTWEDVRPLT